MESSPAFFGSLRSEFDVPDEIPEEYAAIREAVTTVVAFYQEGHISPDVCASAIAPLMLTDEDGIQWAVGPTTTRWYRRLPGGQWRLATPTTRPLPADARTVVAKAQETVSEFTKKVQQDIPGSDETFTDNPSAESDPKPAADRPQSSDFF